MRVYGKGDGRWCKGVLSPVKRACRFSSVALAQTVLHFPHRLRGCGRLHRATQHKVPRCRRPLKHRTSLLHRCSSGCAPCCSHQGCGPGPARDCLFGPWEARVTEEPLWNTLALVDLRHGFLKAWKTCSATCGGGEHECLGRFIVMMNSRARLPGPNETAHDTLQS